MTIIEVPQVKRLTNTENNSKKTIDETDETNEEYDFDAIKEDVIAKHMNL